MDSRVDRSGTVIVAEMSSQPCGQLATGGKLPVIRACTASLVVLHIGEGPAPAHSNLPRLHKPPQFAGKFGASDFLFVSVMPTKPMADRVFLTLGDYLLKGHPTFVRHLPSTWDRHLVSVEDVRLTGRRATIST